MGKSKDSENYMGVDISLSPADLMALEQGTFIGDPIRRTVEKAAAEDNREVDWDTLKVWTNTKPAKHKGVDIRVFVRAPIRETENERADD